MCTTLVIVPGLDRKTKYEVVRPTVMRFTRFLQAMLSEPYSETCDFCLKAECLRSLHSLINRFHKVIEECIKGLFPVLLEILNRCAAEYSLYLAGTKGVPCDKGEDTEPPLFNQLIVNMFHVLQALVIQRHYVALFDDTLNTIVYYLILYQGATPFSEQKWKTDEEAFASADETIESDTQVRNTANNVLLIIAHEFEKDVFINALNLALQRHYFTFLKAEEDTPEYYWRMQEAIMYAVGSISELLISVYKNIAIMRTLKIQDYVTHWTELIDRCQNVNVILLGRIMWVGGRFTCLLSIPDCMKHMTTCVFNLRNSSHVPRISAIR